MVILRRVLDREIAVRHSIKWHEVKLPSYSLHACAYNEIEPLLLMFLIKYAQSHREARYRHDEYLVCRGRSTRSLPSPT